MGAGARKTVWQGTVYRCPSCGETLGSFVARCPACGYEVREADAPASVRELAARIEAIRAGEDATGRLTARLGLAGRSRDEQVASLVRSFPVPNTVEDVLEFALLAASNVDYEAYGVGVATRQSKLGGMTKDKDVLARQALSDAWVAKLEQVLRKAELSFGDAPEFAQVKGIYDDAMARLRRARRRVSPRVMAIVAICLAAVALIVTQITVPSCSADDNEPQATTSSDAAVSDAST